MPPHAANLLPDKRAHVARQPLHRVPDTVMGRCPFRYAFRCVSPYGFRCVRIVMGARGRGRGSCFQRWSVLIVRPLRVVRGLNVCMCVCVYIYIQRERERKRTNMESQGFIVNAFNVYQTYTRLSWLADLLNVLALFNVC